MRRDVCDLDTGDDLLEAESIAQDVMAAITGDRVSHFVYLRLLNHVGYTHLGARDAAGRLVGMPGFLVQVISAGNVPL